VSFEELHRDRARAESFGGAADAYERYRPNFPDALFDDLAALGRDALDVACGTGKVARGLAARGTSVLGVELDARMAGTRSTRSTRATRRTCSDTDARRSSRPGSIRFRFPGRSLRRARSPTSPSDA